MKFLIIILALIFNNSYSQITRHNNNNIKIKAGQKYTEYFISADSVVIKNSKGLLVENFRNNQYPVKIYTSCFKPGVYKLEFYLDNKVIYSELFKQ